MMEKVNDESKLLAKRNQAKEQRDRERKMNIEKTFKLNKLNVVSCGLHHEKLALTRPSTEDVLSMRIQKPLHIFKSLSDNCIEESIIPNILKLPSVKLPTLKRLPPSVTWVFRNKNQLMVEGDSVIGKKQIYYEDGEATHLSDGEECDGKEEDAKEAEKEKPEFLENEDWMLKNEGSITEATSSFEDTIARHFCNRCLIFDCQMHENHLHMNLNKSRRKKYTFSKNVTAKEPCRDICYREQRSVTKIGNDKEKNIVFHEWTPVEKDLLLDGVKIFGKDSCLITKNYLKGLKSCVEVYNYMHEQNQCSILPVQNQTVKTCSQVNKQIPGKRKSTLSHKKKKKRKNTCPPTALQKIVKEGSKMDKQYKPCICEPVCGNECTCLASGNCCEKYCGCSEKCNNRFRGCNCEKGQCHDGRCPCVAAERDCDPDICQSCWLSCGDDSLGGTSVEIQCNNMKFIQKKHKRILIGKSDIHGWGAFTKDALKENEFLGEFTGELISQEEADERGRAEEKLGYSYLFDLNDKYTLDARRQGNKLKFLNHSSNPNCYSKTVMVRGDHRIGFYAAKAIQAGEELFFDYAYKPESQPGWYPK